ncbi:MAG: Gfo/Idh/MocA family protein, partial [Gammaproteobacteria bacterium]
MRILILGCGSIGRRHACNLHQLGVPELMLFDPDGARAQCLATELGAQVVAETTQGYVNRPDAVLICAPTSSHLPLAREAAEHGCHIFIEKPLADGRAGVDSLCELIRQRGLVSLV